MKIRNLYIKVEVDSDDPGDIKHAMGRVRDMLDRAKTESELDIGCAVRIKRLPITKIPQNSTSHK